MNNTVCTASRNGFSIDRNAGREAILIGKVSMDRSARGSNPYPPTSRVFTIELMPDSNLAEPNSTREMVNHTARNKPVYPTGISRIMCTG